MNILIVGKNSYIAKSFCNYVSDNSKYIIDKISVRDDLWKTYDFSKYDVVIYLAGIAHIKETDENKEKYYKINRDLAFEVAVKAKDEGVNHFIFFSSMSVYGIYKGNITKDSVPNPKSNYGKSKLEAENLIKELEDNNFIISIIRPPMVYGKDCRGNFSTLNKFSHKAFIFPKVINQRSMIYIDNLSEFIKVIIDNKYSGLFFPQNDDFICTSEMIVTIGRYINRKIFLVPGFSFIINILSKNISILDKVFGDLTYSKDMSNFEYNYNLIKFDESIKNSI